MQGAIGRDPPDFIVPALMAAGSGAFLWDVQADHLCCCRNAARLHGLSESEAHAGVPLRRVAALVHPDDRAAFLDAIAHQIGHRETFVLDYRAVPTPGCVRRLLVRGRFEVDAGGVTTVGRGLVLDLTAEASVTTLSPLERAADHAIAARRAIDEMPEVEHDALRQHVDALLLEVGRALARRGES